MTKVETRGITPSKESQDDDVEVNGNEDDVHEIEEGETDKKSKHHTPLKARWIFRLINEVIEKTPNLSNREMKKYIDGLCKVELHDDLSSAECEDFCSK